MGPGLAVLRREIPFSGPTAGEFDMRRRAFLGLCGAGLLGLLKASPPAWAAGDTVKLALTDSLVPGLPPKLLDAAARPFKTLVESAMKMRGRIVPGGDPIALAKKLKDDKVQLGIFQGIEFAWARQVNPKMEPVVICVNFQKTVKALLLASAASSFKTPADLHGKTLAVAAGTYEHCWVFLRGKCTSAEPPKKFYKKIVTSTDAEEAIDDVIDGKVQAALVDDLAWESYRGAKPGCAKRLRVVLSSEPFPCAVIAYQKGRYGADTVKRFRKTLLRARDNTRGRQLLSFARLSGFDAVPDDYERHLSSIVKTYPPPQ